MAVLNTFKRPPCLYCFHPYIKGPLFFRLYLGGSLYCFESFCCLELIKGGLPFTVFEFTEGLHHGLCSAPYYCFEIALKGSLLLCTLEPFIP